jgi:hypothetical protein
VPSVVLERQVMPEYKEQCIHFKNIYTDLTKRYPSRLEGA